MKKGRKPNAEPKLAWDRAIALVQVLASDDPETAMRALCEAWEVDPHISPLVPVTLHAWAMSIALARHALAHGREEAE
jgi:hypothetical protein